jgi:predicted O-methyltransferase YrrM
MWIYETCGRLKPAHSLEIGLSYGFSTLFILAAIHQTGSGHHTAIDPYQTTDWHRVGALHAKNLGMERSFECVEKYSNTALAGFVEAKDEFQFIFIDGAHRFDDVLVDFTLAAQVCPIEGEIIFDDMWMPSIRTVVHWIRSNRPDFREVLTPLSYIAHFKRIGNDERNSTHFVPFRVGLNGHVKGRLGPIVTPIKRMLRR